MPTQPLDLTLRREGTPKVEKLDSLEKLCCWKYSSNFNMVQAVHISSAAA